MAERLIHLLAPHIVVPSRVSALSVTRKVLTALRFFASGSYQLDIGRNLNLGLSQSSVSRCVAEVSDALNNQQILDQFIRFPQNYEELNQIRNEFYMQHNLPGVVGCIDCTHVAIFPPKLNDPIYPEAVYVNRKGYHSINVQLICDSNLKIRNVCARFPGSTHDNYIWNHSNILPLLQNLNQHRRGTYYLLGSFLLEYKVQSNIRINGITGDSGYALRPWLLTPLANAEPNTPQGAYNERHMSTRSVIERCNGVLKLRFRCLLKHRVLHYAPNRASKIINSCCILHNMCIENNLPPVPLDDDDFDLDFGMYNAEGIDAEPALVALNRVNPDLVAGRRLQQQIIRNYFTV
ncbi:hypothetical protein MML48_4g00007466 [Holotrichia oblita]|uniref:Uncharacterized protein n=1 Tax=Holotrichia oblita TaxID=644536 RepID=A0ACB9TAC1_HOLOL|nr:hypothetical protein MML48_4g00007466 [Holotrichia oblita]